MSIGMLCKVASVTEAQVSSGVSAVGKRASLLGIIVGSADAGDDKRSFDVLSIVLRDGENGDVKYEAAFFAAAKGGYIGTSNDDLNRPSTQVNFGGDGILFDDSIWCEYGNGPGTIEAVANIVFFYI
ncbi:MAG: hypothetical protein CL489_16745 [Acidobacteria bacterium]|nr:hypothetical protein [Acidobacteriota bacterium]